FAVPFLLYALGRAAEAESWSKALAKATIGAGAGASIAGGPWLLHAWRESLNPFFPLATSLFPSPLWKVRLDSIWQQGFAFGKGLRSWLLLPIDMTIHTNRFAENKPGTFGLTFLAILFFSAVALGAASRTERVWLASAVAGTLLVWTQNPLVRYWMPALWLAVPAAARGAEATARRVGRRTIVAGLAGIVVLQVAIDAFPTKGDLEGRRWAVYTGRTSEAEFIGRMPGADALAGLARIDPTFPKVWYSGIFAVGHADVVPLVGERWELALHAPVGNRQALFRWIDSVGCRYWAVANALPDRAEFERIGVAERYWHDSDIVIRDATTTIYRMPAGDILTK
ncbi:MAG TPA: hypothetical protein VFL12_08255, partial [Thermoanaerobaculia bacterium]|nr:hypothetical protein [Thermoanaerobaculia bacterium]